MTHLPHSLNLPTGILSAVFANTSATYKFYWFMAIIESVEQGKTVIPKRHLFARMLANAWYTVNYFRVSFGKQDLIQQAVHFLLELEQLTIEIRKDTILEVLENSAIKGTNQLLGHFDKNVPHWFLSPWFLKGRAGEEVNKAFIYNASQHFENNCLYALSANEIKINLQWLPYLQHNAGVLKAFCYWHLSLFLQARNPNVPDIPNKLIRPALRSPLTLQRKKYWDIVLREVGGVDCIFTNKAITACDYALDHFIPHAFVSHDLIWNLVPIASSFNSVKSDRLPSIENHFDGFFKIQKLGFEIISHHAPKSRLLEDYLTVFPNLSSVSDFNYSKFKEVMQPLVVIAGNNGFKPL